MKQHVDNNYIIVMFSLGDEGTVIWSYWRSSFSRKFVSFLCCIAVLVHL